MSAVTETEFKVDGHDYRSSRMSVFDQQTVASKLGGVLLLVGDGQDEDDTKKVPLKPGEKPRKPPTPEDFVRAFCALSGDIRKSDSDLVLDLCMAGVERKQQGDIGWAKVAVQRGLLAFDDINLREMLLIVWHVLKQHRIPDFFTGPRSPSP